MIFLELFLTFLKIGAVSFGGGYAMIPLVTDEVLAHGWMNYEQIMNFIAVAESTPGPIAINMATYIGATQGATMGGVGFSLLGAFCSTLGVVLPSFVIILLIASIIKGLLHFAGVKAFIGGLRPIVVALIVGTGLTMFLSVIFSFKNVYSSFNFDWKSLVIFALVVATHFIYKKIVKKKISPILLILISALLGIIFYGLIP